MPTYPGNPNVSFTPVIKRNSQITTISFGTHTGTHIDAPLHTIPSGSPIDAIDLEAFVGPCTVVDFSQKNILSISGPMLEKISLTKNNKVLFKTDNSYSEGEVFTKDYVYIEPSAAEYLAQQKVSLVGIDALSIKKSGDTDNTPHTALLSKNIPILEGINLKAVSEGEYFLVCAPLKLKGLDGAPARAFLIK